MLGTNLTAPLANAEGRKESATCIACRLRSRHFRETDFGLRSGTGGRGSIPTWGATYFSDLSDMMAIFQVR